MSIKSETIVIVSLVASAGNIASGSTVTTDCWKGYAGLEEKGFVHKMVLQSKIEVKSAYCRASTLLCYWSNAWYSEHSKDGLRGNTFNDTWRNIYFGSITGQQNQLANVSCESFSSYQFATTIGSSDSGGNVKCT